MKHTPILADNGAKPHRAFDRSLVERANRELAFLRLRRRRLPSARLSDAHWAILLQLYVAHASNHRSLTKEVEAIANVPNATLLRYLTALEDEGLITRSECEDDRRVTFVDATEKGVARIVAILAEARIAEAGDPPTGPVKRATGDVQ